MENNREEVVAVIETASQVEGEAELSKTVTDIELRAESVTITSQEDYQAAAEFGCLIKQRSSEVQAFFEPMKKAAHVAHKQVCDRERQMLTPLVNAEKVIKKTMGAWAMEQERIRREEEEALRKAAQAESDRLLAVAIEAEENGNKAAADAAMANASVIDQAGRSISLGASKPQAEGVSMTTDWELVEVNNREVPLSLNGIELRPVDSKAVMRLIRASKGKIVIPGITYKAVAKMSFRK